MNWFEKIIVNVGKKISERDEEDRVTIYLTNKELDERLEKLKNKYWTIILSELTKTRINMKNNPPLIKEGDDAIFNIYDLVHPSSNGWDTGAKSMEPYISNQGPEALKVTIKEVQLATSLASDRVDRFFDNYSVEWIQENTNDGEKLWEVYSNWYKKHFKESYFFENYAYYWQATFKTNVEFKPIWGLNINSFLIKGEKGYDETLSIYSLQNKINRIENDSRKNVKLLKERIKIIEDSI